MLSSLRWNRERSDGSDEVSKVNWHRNRFGLLAFDLRGHGKSGGKRGHAPSYDAIMGDIDHMIGEAGRLYPTFLCSSTGIRSAAIWYCTT